MASKRIANPSVVRQWAKDTLASGGTIAGLPEGYTVAVQGRLHPAIREAYTKAHKGEKVVEGGFVRTRTVKGVRVTESGRKVPFSKAVDTTQVRAAAKAAGVSLPDKGRLPNAVVRAFALGEYAPKA